MPETSNQGDAVSRLRQLIDADQCIVLDGAIATELQRRGARGFELSDDNHWGFDALHNSPSAVLDVHAAYVDAGADVLTTNTYSILEAPGYAGHFDIHQPRPVHWMDMARTAIELPREAIKQAGREGEVAVAFSIGGDIATAEQQETVQLLLRAIQNDPPDLILFETVSMIDDNLTLETVRTLVEQGWPVWVSFRRCRKGLCGIHGQLWGGPEGDRFGRLAQQLEAAGAGALLINCLPVSRVEGTLPWLRDYTDLPLGVYPNVGRYVDSGWRFDETFTPEDFADQAVAWREEGAQIIGGCCGVGPTDIRVASDRLQSMPAGRVTTRHSPMSTTDFEADTPAAEMWQDDAGRNLYPLPLPSIAVDKGVFVPTQGSYLIWKYLFRNGIGNEKDCLDIGCGVGILAIQMALNGATSVTAIDIQKEAIDNTMTNAFRNGVADRMEGMAEDLYSYHPQRSYDVIVASLYQMPTDPRGQYNLHRDVDYWGRNLLDHFISQLPVYLADDGVAYLMQVSMLGAQRTESLLKRYGYTMRVADFNLYQFNPVFSDNLEQIQRVESLSDAYHFHFGDNENVMVMYLLEVRREGQSSADD